MPSSSSVASHPAKSRTRGAKVYAAARRPESVDLAGAIPLRLEADPADVAARALTGLEKGLPEILADETTRYVKQGLAAAPSAA
ncbi:hypothetical protein ACFU6S_28215 [Streptomyces sp. NPDC057456]|uniref:hypothetical protein n=1 Tax=Streptomyces sp. NPDC057456 TaxID=3346139 RepID=UPI0036C084C3